MPQQMKGNVTEKQTRRGIVRGLRFTACGGRRYVTLPDGTTRDEAERELRRVRSEVERGVWQPPTPPPVVELRTGVLTFHEFATEWYREGLSEWRPNTQADYLWQLSSHLLPFFKDHQLAQITVDEVDRYRRFKLDQATKVRARAAEGKPIMDEYTDKRGRRRKRPRKALSATSINKTLTRLGQVLAVAEERKLIPSNPLSVNPRKRKLRTTKKQTVYLDNADHITALLEGARQLDAEAKSNGQMPRRELLATLVFAGPRISEALDAEVSDLDLAASRLRLMEWKDVHVGAAQDAGERFVDLLPVLRELLADYRARTPDRPGDAPLFPSSSGGRQCRNRARTRILHPAIARANAILTAEGKSPLPAGLTLHGLRHTFVSLLFALGRDVPYVMAQAGHDDEGTTLRIYAKIMRTSDAERERLRALAEGIEVVPSGAKGSSDATTAPLAVAA
jgi:integrase